MQDTCFQHIAKLIRKGKVSLFIGAGFSYEAGAPHVSDLKQQLLNGLTTDEKEELNEQSQLHDIAEQYEKFDKRGQLVAILQNTFKFSPLNLYNQQTLAKIPQLKTIFTTNYDTLIEDAYNGQCNVIRTNEDLVDINHNLPTIYKLHGDFSAPQNIIISETDYSDFYFKHVNQVLWQSVCAELVKNHIVFIGYSFSDTNIKYILDNLVQQMGRHSRKMYLIAPQMNNSNKQLLNKKGIEYIQADAKDFLNAIIPEIRDNIAADYRDHIATAEECCIIMNQYDIIPEVQPQDSDKPNIIKNVMSKSGKPLQHSIYFTLNGSVQNPLAQIPTQYNKFGVPYKQIPFNTLTHSINSLLFETEKDISKLWLFADCREIDVNLFVPEQSLSYKCSLLSYRDLDTQKPVMVANLCIGILKLVWGTPTKDNLRLEITFNDEYTDNQKAIREMQIILAYAKKLTIKGTLIPKKDPTQKRDFTFTNPLDYKNEINDSECRLQYYTYIQNIENKTQEQFEKYYNYTPLRFKYASYLYHYLTGQPLEVKNKPNEELNLKTTDKNFRPTTKQVYALVEEYSNVSFNLNQKIFTIPYAMIQRTSCKFIRKKKINNAWQYTYCDLSPKYYVIFKDTPFLPLQKEQTATEK